MSSENQAFTRDEISDLTKILSIRYGQFLNGRFFSIIHEEHDSFSEAKIILENNDQSFVYPVEGRMQRSPKSGFGHREAVMMLLDFMSSYFEEYFENDENTFIPLDWKEFNFEGKSLHLRGQVRNLKQEKAADALLAQAELADSE